VVAKLREKEIEVPEIYQPDIFFAQLGESAKKRSMVIYEQLRKNFKMSQAFYKDSLKAQLESANRLKVKFCIILGQKEVNEDTIMLRDMNGGVQEIISLGKLEAELTKRLEKYNSEEGVEVIDTEETRAALASKKRPHTQERDTEENNLEDLGGSFSSDEDLTVGVADEY